MKKILVLVGLLTLVSTLNIFGQLSLPYESNRQEIMQVVGDSKITIVYHRPNVKGRAGKIYGCKAESEIQKGNNTGPCLVPNGQVWRAGANNNTSIEFSTDVTINGQPLPAGKYGFFAIPQDNEWTLIFNKVNNEWGAFTYKVDQDVLRVKVTPTKLAAPRETLMYEFNNVAGNNATVSLSWENISVPFTVNVGDINARVVNYIRNEVKNRKPDDVRPLNQGAGFVMSNKLKANYEEALSWLDESIKVKETFGNLNAKARLLAEMGKKAEAIATAEKAIQVGKAASPAANTANLEAEVQKWKGSK
jgi:tetratricopeptide (TPR) repeat protein